MRTTGFVVVAIAAVAVIVLFLRFGGGKASREEFLPRQSSQQAGGSNQYLDACSLADGFVFPVGPPEARGYYDAQGFGKNDHLGEDWNGTGGQNTDLGDPIYSIARGIVIYAEEAGPGWGNVVRIYHNIGTKDDPQFVESLYGHLKTVEVSRGETVAKGQRLGTMGNVGGKYYAHLHLELRTSIGMPIGGGYSRNKSGFVAPTEFIRSHMNMKNVANQAMHVTPEAGRP